MGNDHYTYLQLSKGLFRVQQALCKVYLLPVYTMQSRVTVSHQTFHASRIRRRLPVLVVQSISTTRHHFKLENSLVLNAEEKVL